MIIFNESANEIAQNPQALEFQDGLDASHDGEGKVTVGIRNSYVGVAKTVETEARTASADGTGTGAVSALTASRKVVAVTSASATNQIALPAASTATIGQEVLLVVGANGYELITPASSGATINLVDGDGTNQLDVAANTTLLCIQVGASAWIAIQVAATAITVVAPDND